MSDAADRAVKISPVVLAALLCISCAPAKNNSTDDSVARLYDFLNDASPACPTIPVSSGVVIAGKMGPDFWDCTASTRSGKPLFDIYVGDHPPTEKGLKYGGVTENTGKGQVWFRVGDPIVRERNTWYAYIPAGNRRGSVILVSFTVDSDDEFKRRAGLVAQLEKQFHK